MGRQNAKGRKEQCVPPDQLELGTNALDLSEDGPATHVTHATHAGGDLVPDVQCS